VREALFHRGFSFIDILQICATYNDLTEYYDAHVYNWDEANAGDHRAAYDKAREWDYTHDAKIGLGIMYRHTVPVFEDAYPVPELMSTEKRAEWVRRIIEERG
jgi:2-oxoglutarate ferredoxin oxidoreductase subunit beta